MVLPVPLTPHTRITCGRCAGSSWNGRAAGSRIVAIDPASAPHLLIRDLLAEACPAEIGDQLGRGLTPRSAVISASSSCSRGSASSLRLVRMAEMLVLSWL